MSKLSVFGIALVSALGFASAQALEFGKPLTSSVVITRPTNTMGGIQSSNPPKKFVTLMNIKLTPKQKRAILNFPRGDKEVTKKTSDLPRQADVGMNGVPVLDQGAHGSCVTFANTAAIDALLGKGDYISQLCNLELGAYFEEKGYLPSGWDGTIGPLALNQMLGFGIMSKTNQRAKTCGGLKEYPLANPYTTGNPMSLDEFKQSSENLNDSMYWNPVLTIFERFQWEPATASKQADELLLKIKKILATKSPYQDQRLSFAVLVPVDYCSAGACGRYHSDEDSWVLTQAILNDQELNFGGHEMVITGYDDDAVAVDHDGTRHQGLLTLRNSWGENAGDHGNYYMSYDFFKQLVIEVQQIVVFKDSDV